jgi:hypothetical protein
MQIAVITQDRHHRARIEPSRVARQPRGGAGIPAARDRQAGMIRLAHHLGEIKWLPPVPEIFCPRKVLQGRATKIEVGADGIGVGNSARAIDAPRRPMPSHRLQHERFPRVGDDKTVIVIAF